VLRLVDCSLVVPPQPGPDGRSRYVLLETPRAYGARQLADASEQDEVAAARRLDAEDATTHQVLAWALSHDPALGLRLAVALAPWWNLRGRLTGEYPLLGQAAGYAPAGSDGWCAATVARILSTVLFGLATLELIRVRPHHAGNYLAHFVIGGHVYPVIHSVFGATVPGLIVPVLLWLAGLAAVWLLWRPAATAFFKPRTPGSAGETTVRSV
jgi:hypothetical protein